MTVPHLTLESIFAKKKKNYCINCILHILAALEMDTPIYKAERASDLT